MPYTTLFFDLDDTLYPKTSGLWEAIRARMGDFMRDRLGFPPDVIPDLRRSYFETYGTTLRGLLIHNQVDADEYLSYVHDLPLEDFIQPDPELRDLILSLPHPKWIFTNADSGHAGRVLAYLGLDDCFKGIIDVRAIGFSCKPNLEAYTRALALVGEPDPRYCVLLDDAPRNLQPARQLGFTTVLVGSEHSDPAADYTISRLQDLPQVLPALWSTPIVH
jgi:putative hydrolase of the HAD superfamily